MNIPHPAFAAATALTRPSSRPAPSLTSRRRAAPRMQAATPPTPAALADASAANTSVVETPVWPPPEMSSEWAEAIQRLTKAVPESTHATADTALSGSDGDEARALQQLTLMHPSATQLMRERAADRARENGDPNRVSAIKEAEMRRRATGSARDFFKGYVEIQGKYVDSGYVDEEADIGRVLSNTFARFFKKK